LKITACDFWGSGRITQNGKNDAKRQELLKLDAIYRITRLITGEPEVLVERTFYAAIILAQAESGSMFMRLSRKERVLRLVSAENLQIDKTMIKPGKLDQWVLERKQPLLLHKDSIPPDLKPYLVKPEKVRSSMVVPIVFKDETIGVINLNNKIGEEGFTTEDLNFVHSLANILAAVIYNYLLLGELKEERQALLTSLRILTQLAEAMEQAQDENEFLKAVVSALESAGLHVEVTRKTSSEGKRTLVWSLPKEGDEKFLVIRPSRDMDQENFERLMPALNYAHQVCKSGFISKATESAFQNMTPLLIFHFC